MRYFLLAALFSISFMLCSCGEATPEQHATAADKLQKQIATHVSSELVEGTGIVILIDVSGSMASSVKNEQGADEPKISIARRNVNRIAENIDKYCKDHPDKNVQICIATFNSETSVIVMPSKPDLAAIKAAVEKIDAGGGTQIGDAMLEGKRLMDGARLRNIHIITVTDGENGGGADPADVTMAFKKLEQPPSVYLIGFDVDSSVYKPVKDAGALVLSAADEASLKTSLNFVFEKKILLEKEE